MKAKRRLTEYGLSDEDWHLLTASGHCPLCLRHYVASNPACVDHDHHTHFVDGACCMACNHWLGGRRRDAEFYQRVADYLRNPPALALPGSRRRAFGMPESLLPFRARQAKAPRRNRPSP